MSPLPITRALKVGANRSHLEGLKQKDMEGYLKHHLEIAGIKELPFCTSESHICGLENNYIF
jgi:hypothetical protein